MTTILVDQDLCTRCGICSRVCPMGIVDPADENTLPRVDDNKAGYCIRCGHCEVTCPSRALLLNFRSDERIVLPEDGELLHSDGLGTYLKKRRSVRHFRKDPVPKEKIMEVLEVAQYAASGGNSQPVQWLVVSDPEEIRKIGEATVGWMKTLLNTSHPMSGFAPTFINAWEAGNDVFCRNAPHLLIAHTADNGNPTAYVDAIIAMTHFDIAAPASGIGTCWAGIISIAAGLHPPLQEALGIPKGHKFVYAMMFGYPQYTIHGIPRRNPVQVTWR